VKPYKRIYLEARNLTPTDFIPCEVCGAQAVDIHHIQARGMGGSKSRDTPENLIALCRSCHHEADFGTGLSKEYLRQIVTDKLNERKTTQNRKP
jgi:5-methylcytosine-specific restriction endonuclease McrA